MTRFAIGKPIATSEPSITVDAGLDPGSHLFQLEVVTSDRRTSKPDVVTVVVEGDVRGLTRPVGAVRARKPRSAGGPPIPDPE